MSWVALRSTVVLYLYECSFISFFIHHEKGLVRPALHGIVRMCIERITCLIVEKIHTILGKKSLLLYTFIETDCFLSDFIFKGPCQLFKFLFFFVTEIWKPEARNENNLFRHCAYISEWMKLRNSKQHHNLSEIRAFRLWYRGIYAYTSVQLSSFIVRAVVCLRIFLRAGSLESKQASGHR